MTTVGTPWRLTQTHDSCDEQWSTDLPPSYLGFASYGSQESHRCGIWIYLWMFWSCRSMKLLMSMNKQWHDVNVDLPVLRGKKCCEKMTTVWSCMVLTVNINKCDERRKNCYTVVMKLIFHGKSFNCMWNALNYEQFLRICCLNYSCVSWTLMVSIYQSSTSH